MNQTACALCGTQATSLPRTGDLLEVTCPRCGNFSIVGTAISLLEHRPIENPGAVSGWIRRQNAMGITPKFDGDAPNRLRALTKPPFRERAEQYLLAAAAGAPRLNQTFIAAADDLVGTSYSDDANELNVILEYLRREGLIAEQHQGSDYLTPQGYISADELRTRRAASTQAFVAMWFTDEMVAVYNNGLDPGIRYAGFKPMLISNKEHANKIDDEIIAEIRRSAFLVADFTGHRQNVYFEIGFGGASSSHCSAARRWRGRLERAGNSWTGCPRLGSCR
jgi:hypothetical protein